MNNILHTKIFGKTMLPVWLIPNCEQFTTCVSSDNVTHTRIVTNPSSETIQVSSAVADQDGQLIHCYQLADDTDWFGGPQIRYQHWPIQHMYFNEEPYVPTHPTNMAVTERYWLSSKGIYIFADDNDPLFLDQNNYKDKHLCLVAKNKDPYRERDTVTLKYEIGAFSNPKIAHMNVVKNHLGKPTGIPDERMIKYPIWSTWARYKDNINEEIVNKFAQEILDNSFTNSQLEIDDNWETCYGSAIFDSTKFPDVQKLTTELKQKGFRVTLWVHPFINEDCIDGVSYDYALQNNYLVENLEGNTYTTWWQGNEVKTIPTITSITTK